MAGSAKYGDVIEAKEGSHGQLRYIRVVEESKLKFYEFILSKNIIESDALNNLKDKLSKLNIYWQQDFGVVLYFLCQMEQN